MSRYDFADGTFDYGAPLTRDQVLDAAVDRFTAAMDVAGEGSDELYLARVGLARTLLNKGDFAGAATQAADVPTGWLFRAEHDAQDGQENPVWDFNISQERWSAAEQEGGAGLPYLSAADPRMLWRRTGGTDRGFDRYTPQYDALKYADRPAFAIIADGVEARLIEAEAALHAGDADGMLAILNDLRGQVGALMAVRNWDFQTRLVEAGFPATLPALELPATYDEQVDLLFRERAFWLWLSAHRLGDMRRLIRQYDRSPDAVFPTGVYAPHGNPKGGSYGPDVNFPIPVQEEGNPEDGAGQCMNRNA